MLKDNYLKNAQINECKIIIRHNKSAATSTRQK